MNSDKKVAEPLIGTTTAQSNHKKFQQCFFFVIIGLIAVGNLFLIVFSFRPITVFNPYNDLEDMRVQIKDIKSNIAQYEKTPLTSTGIFALQRTTRQLSLALAAYPSYINDTSPDGQLPGDENILGLQKDIFEAYKRFQLLIKEPTLLRENADPDVAQYAQILYSGLEALKISSNGGVSLDSAMYENRCGAHSSKCLQAYRSIARIYAQKFLDFASDQKQISTLFGIEFYEDQDDYFAALTPQLQVSVLLGDIALQMGLIQGINHPAVSRNIRAYSGQAEYNLEMKYLKYMRKLNIQIQQEVIPLQYKIQTFTLTQNVLTQQGWSDQNVVNKNYLVRSFLLDEGNQFYQYQSQSFAFNGYAQEVIIDIGKNLTKNDVWAQCPDGYWLTAFERTTFVDTLDWLPQIQKIRCSRPYDVSVIQVDCQNLYTRGEYYTGCNVDQYLVGFYKNNGDSFLNFEQARCCTPQLTYTKLVL